MIDATDDRDEADADHSGPSTPSTYRAPAGVVQLGTLTVLALAMFGLGAMTAVAGASAWYFVAGTALALMAAALIATIWVEDIARLVDASTLARIVFGIDTLLLAGTMSGGIVASILAWSTLQDLGVSGGIVIGAIALMGCLIAILGLLIAAGWAPARPLFALLRSLRKDDRSGAGGPLHVDGSTNPPSMDLSAGLRDLTPAGCLLAVFTGLVIFGGGIPLTWWLYEGERPAWIPSIVLALPIFALALAFIGACVLVAHSLGIRLLLPARRGKSDPP